MSKRKSVLKDGARGALAARIRQRKFALSKKFGIPEDLLPGSLCLTHSRCGKKTCHCAGEQGHPVWLLTFMVQGKKRVERIPPEWVEDVQRRVEAGRKFKDAVAEVFAANAQLLALWRRQTKGRHR
jgi:hypothetical protein